MNAVLSLLWHTLGQVIVSLQHNWPYLALSIAAAVALKLSVDPSRASRWLARHRGAGIVGATLAAVLTPLCSCGTTAVVLGMVAGTMPWAPIVAFMVASPLTSPEELFYSAGLFGWPFAATFFVASIALGLAGGALAALLERRGWLANQARLTLPEAGEGETSVSLPAETCAADAGAAAPGRVREVLATLWRNLGAGWSMTSAGYAPYPVEWPAATLPPLAPVAACCAGSESMACPVGAAEAVRSGSGCAAGARPVKARTPRVTVRRILNETATVGHRLLWWFVGFAFIGYFLNGLIPAAWISALFGAGRIHSVPLAATLGLPLYVNSEASLPLVRTMLDSGMSEGAALAFLITGAGTSIGAIAGALTIARWRVVALVVGTLWVGAMATGYLFDLWRMTMPAGLS